MQYLTHDIKTIVQDEYGIPVKACTEIKTGVMNANYCITSRTGGEKYLFKIYNFKKKSQVAFEVEVLEFLEQKNFPAPRLLTAKRGQRLLSLKGRPCILYRYIEGKNVTRITPQLLNKVGILEGRLHRLLRNFTPTVAKPTWDPEDLRVLTAKNRKMMIESNFQGAEALMDFVEKELAKFNFSSTLPRGITHQDIKPENIIIGKSGSLHFIDFDNAYQGVLLHDLTTTIIWTCFNKNGKLNRARFDALLKGYVQGRSLTIREKKELHQSIRFRFVREAFIGPFVTLHMPGLSKERSDYFIRTYMYFIQSEESL